MIKFVIIIYNIGPNHAYFDMEEVPGIVNLLKIFLNWFLGY